MHSSYNEQKTFTLKELYKFVIKDLMKFNLYASLIVSGHYTKEKNKSIFLKYIYRQPEEDENQVRFLIVLIPL
jgi:hypothetical protein